MIAEYFSGMATVYLLVATFADLQRRIPQKHERWQNALFVVLFVGVLWFVAWAMTGFAL